jgi:pyrroloquinoline quinone (PQQ) biosynthesis protein C
MPDARSVVARIEKDLAEIAERLLRHPYLEALEQGRVPKEALRPFAGEQFHIIESDLRSVAYLVNRFGASPSRDFFLGILQGERAAMEALLVFARALGLSEPALRAYDPAPGAHAYTAYMAWLALYGSAAQVAAGYLVNFPAWGRNCGRLAAILKARFGFADEEVRFFQLFAAPPPTFEEAALSVIQQGLDAGEEPAAIARAARLLQAYELMYWDTLRSISGL